MKGEQLKGSKRSEVSTAHAVSNASIRADAFWTARGVAFAMHRYRKKNGNPSAIDYHTKCKKGLYPWERSAQRALRATQYTRGNVPVPKKRAWNDAEVIYSERTRRKTSMRTLAAMLGKSTRSVSRQLSKNFDHLSISLRTLDHVLGLRDGCTGKFMRTVLGNKNHLVNEDEILAILKASRSFR